MNLYLTKKDVEHVIPTRVPTAIVETHDDKDNDDDKAELAAVKLEPGNDMGSTKRDTRHRAQNNGR